ncbi:DUF4365 domain-containing protein [Actinomadura sp. 7K507]|uniref:DUF4365 domain-containing protein n=1 Tax=Actinomadura sp. 7K507 TaxID=2530365 RepID=UPI00140426C7|nr:DUF4365 domain-containing protein [Actinomadura sp. 7K507]
MDARNHQGGYGEAFVSALAVAAGLRLAKPIPDVDGIDFCMWPDGVGALRGARASGVNVQVKSGSVATETDTTWGYRLEVPHFNFLADALATVYPTLLFLVIVPKDRREYATAEPDGLLLRNAAYWHSLANADPIANPKEGTKTTVHVPKANLLTVDSLRALVEDPQKATEAQAEAS